MDGLKEKLKKFIDFSVYLSGSHLLVCVGKEIVYSKSPYSDSELVLGELSKEILEILTNFEKNKNSTKEVFIKKVDETIPLLKDDTTFYTGQVFLPVWYRGELKMVLIYYRTFNNYIDSSTKVMKTTQAFIPRFLDAN